MAIDVGAIVGRLEMNVNGWSAAVDKVKKDQQSLAGFALRHKEQIQNLGKAFAVAGGAITAALGAAAVKTANFGDEINDLSQRTGVSTETLSGYKLAADNSGTSISTLAMGLKGLSSNMVDAAGGIDAAGKKFEALGISVVNADGSLRSSNDVLLDVAQRFSEMEDGAEKTALAVDLFGKAGMEMIPFLNMGREGLRANYENAQRFGAVVSQEAARACDEFNDSLGNMKAALGGTVREIGGAVMPSIQGLIEKVTSVAVKVRGWAAEHPGLVSSLGSVAGTIGLVLMQAGPLLMALPKLVSGWQTLTTILHTSAAALAASLAGLTALAAGAVMVYQTVNTMIGAKEDSVEADYEMSLSNDAVGQKLRRLADAAGVTRAELVELTSKYGDNNNKLQVAIQKGKDQDATLQKLHAAMVKAREATEKQTGALSAAAQTTGQVTAALENLGLVSRDAAKKELDKLVQSIDTLNSSGEVSRAGLVDAAAKAVELAAKYNLSLTPAIRDLATGITATVGELATLTDEALDAAQLAIPKLGTSIDRTGPPLENMWTQLGVLFRQIKDGNIPITFQFEQRLAYWSNQLKVSEASIVDMVMRLANLQLAFMNIHIPTIRMETSGFNQDVSTLSTRWDDLVRDVTQGWAGAIQGMVEGTTSFRDFLSQTWGAIKQTFFRMVADIVTKWITDGILKLTSSAASGATAVGGAFQGMGNTIASVATSVMNTIKSVVTVILDVITAIGKTVVDIAAYAIETLAKAIAAAIKALAAAAPELLELGIVAAAIYTAFKLGGALVDAIGGIIGGGGGNSDITDWLKVIYDTIILYGIALGGHLIFLSDRFVELFPKVDNLAACVNTARQAIWDILLIAVNRITDLGNKIINGLSAIKTAIQSIPQAAGGGASMATQLVMLHGTPDAPEYIIPHNELGRFVAGLEGGGAGAAAAARAPALSLVLQGPLIQTTGLARADLESAADEIYRVFDQQAARRGWRLNNG